MIIGRRVHPRRTLEASVWLLALGMPLMFRRVPRRPRALAPFHRVGDAAPRRSAQTHPDQDVYGPHCRARSTIPRCRSPAGSGTRATAKGSGGTRTACRCGSGGRLRPVRHRGAQTVSGSSPRLSTTRRFDDNEHFVDGADVVRRDDARQPPRLSADARLAAARDRQITARIRSRRNDDGAGTEHLHRRASSASSPPPDQARARRRRVPGDAGAAMIRGSRRGGRHALDECAGSLAGSTGAARRPRPGRSLRSAALQAALPTAACGAGAPRRHPRPGRERRRYFSSSRPPERRQHAEGAPGVVIVIAEDTISARVRDDGSASTRTDHRRHRDRRACASRLAAVSGRTWRRFSSPPVTGRG